MTDTQKKTLSEEQKAKMLEGRRKKAEERKQAKEIEKLEKKQNQLQSKKLQIEAIAQQKDRLKQERKAMEDRKIVRGKFKQLREQLNTKPEENQENINRINEAILKIENDEKELTSLPILDVTKELPKEPPKELPKEPPKELPKKPVIKEYATQDQFKNIIDKIASTLTNDKAKHIFKNTVSSYNPNDSLDTNMSKLMEIAHNQIRLNSEEITKKIKEEDQLLKIKEEEIELQKKKDKNARLRARARKYLYC